VKRKIIAALLPVVAFAAFALAPAMAQAANVTLKEGSRTLQVGETLKFEGTTLFDDGVLIFQCKEELTGQVISNPGATIEITGSHFEDPVGGRCRRSPYYPELTVEPVISPGHMLKVQKTGNLGYFEFNEVPTRFDFYKNSSKIGVCNMLLNSIGEWTVGTSQVFLEGSYLRDPNKENSSGCSLEVTTSADFSVTTTFEGTESPVTLN
jgi:hypothetical protein